MLPIRIGAFAFAGCILVLCLGGLVQADISCLDEEGNPVDWFIAYKFPKLEGRDENFEAGVAYSYITSNDVEDEEDEIAARTDDPESKIFIYRFKNLLLKYLGYKAPKKTMKKSTRRIAKTANNGSRWVVSDYAIGEPESIVMRTLAPAYEKKSSNINSIFYNDDPSHTHEPTPTDKDESDDESDSDTEGESEAEEAAKEETANEEAGKKKGRKKQKHNDRRAHAKGVLLMDEKSMNGLWLTHSVPKFPKVRAWELDYPSSGTIYGQTLMCVSFKVADSAAKLVDHLVNMRVLVYDKQIGEKLDQMIPALKNLDLEAIIKNRRIPVVPQLSQMITTRAGQALHLFSKSGALQNDLYSRWIDEELGADLYVATWRNGNGKPLGSFCPKGDYHVNNVQDLKYDEQLQWAYSKDHSKWAITEKKDDRVVCISDSNRMESQFKRGGGAVCIQCSTCWDVFSNTIQDVEPCRKDTGRFPSTEHKDARVILDKIRKVLHL